MGSRLQGVELPTYRYRASILRKMETIREEYDYLLKIETSTLRVWLAKYNKDEGMWGDNVVTVEKRKPKEKEWFQIAQYESD